MRGRGGTGDGVRGRRSPLDIDSRSPWPPMPPQSMRASVDHPPARARMHPTVISSRKRERTLRKSGWAWRGEWRGAGSAFTLKYRKPRARYLRGKTGVRKIRSQAARSAQHAWKRRAVDLAAHKDEAKRGDLGVRAGAFDAYLYELGHCLVAVAMRVARRVASRFDCHLSLEDLCVTST